jgi:hypothetical protein
MWGTSTRATGSSREDNSGHGEIRQLTKALGSFAVRKWIAACCAVLACYVLLTWGASKFAGLPGNLPKGFENQLERIGLSRCVWMNVRVERVRFNGAFMPDDEHNPMRISREHKPYLVILSSDLDREYKSSTDGSGGKRFSDAFNNRNRYGMTGFTVHSTIYCPEYLEFTNYSDFMFSTSFGSGVLNSRGITGLR